MKTVQDVLSVIADTHDQIKKADELLKRAAQAKPGALVHLVEPTAKLRDGLKVDLELLEVELERLAL